MVYKMSGFSAYKMIGVLENGFGASLQGYNWKLKLCSQTSQDSVAHDLIDLFPIRAKAVSISVAQKAQGI